MSGMSGQLFKEVGFTIVYSLTASLIFALTLTPMLFSRMCPREKENTWVSRKVHWLEDKYALGIGWALNHQKSVLLIAVGLVVVAVLSYTTLDSELMPSSDEGTISVSVTTKTGLNDEATQEIMDQVETIVAGVEGLDSYTLRAAGDRSPPGSPFWTTAPPPPTRWWTACGTSWASWKTAMPRSISRVPCPLAAAPS